MVQFYKPKTKKTKPNRIQTGQFELVLLLFLIKTEPKIITLLVGVSKNTEKLIKPRKLKKITKKTKP